METLNFLKVKNLIGLNWTGTTMVFRSCRCYWSFDRKHEAQGLLRIIQSIPSSK